MIRQSIDSLKKCLADLLSRGDVSARQEREKLGQIRLERESYPRAAVRKHDIIDRIHSDQSLTRHIREQDRQLEQYLFHENDIRHANECAAVDSQTS